MERKVFQAWLTEVDSLTEAQKAEAAEVLAGRPAGEAALAAIELGVGAGATHETGGRALTVWRAVPVIPSSRRVSRDNDSV
jgi:hypothetical protein